MVCLETSDITNDVLRSTPAIFVAGGFYQLSKTNHILKDEVYKLGTIGGLWISKFIHIVGSCESDPINIVMAYQKTDKTNIFRAYGKINGFIGLYHDGENVYLKNMHRQQINVNMVVMTKDGFESIGAITDISTWTKIEVAV